MRQPRQAHRCPARARRKTMMPKGSFVEVLPLLLLLGLRLPAVLGKNHRLPKHLLLLAEGGLVHHRVGPSSSHKGSVRMQRRIGVGKEERELLDSSQGPLGSLPTMRSAMISSKEAGLSFKILKVGSDLMLTRVGNGWVSTMLQ